MKYQGRLTVIILYGVLSVGSCFYRSSHLLQFVHCSSFRCEVQIQCFRCFFKYSPNVLLFLIFVYTWLILVSFHLFHLACCLPVVL
jgi:hypothetical protein